LGTNSIGWAIINEAEKTDEKSEILDMGCRIVPLSPDDKSEFESGNAISKNQKRTQKRTQRKGYDRYQMRRLALRTELKRMGLMPDEGLFKLKPAELWGLRARAVYQKVELRELGRLLYHLNQKRGYKSTRKDENRDKKETEYVAEVKGRHDTIKGLGMTIGQYFYDHLKEDENYRIKEQVFPREAYIEEFDAIWNRQKQYYPEILTEREYHLIRNEIIYYQRDLKSCKHLVKICEFEGQYYKNKEGKLVFNGPKVAPKSSPIFQMERLWETINTLSIRNKFGDTIYSVHPPGKTIGQNDRIMTVDERSAIFQHLDNRITLKDNDLIKILRLDKEGGWYGNKQLEKGIPGNSTRIALLKALNGFENTEDLLRFSSQIEEYKATDKTSGEILIRKCISASCENEPFYRLWHAIYSIDDKTDLTRTLSVKFNIPENIAEELVKIDFTKQGFGNKSAKASRKILPYLMAGSAYSNACLHAGYTHSDSLTTSDNLRRILLDKLAPLPKNSLRQPIVEKILNQMINLVNSIIDEHGRPDEIRVELARELKQSKEERNVSFKQNSERERENKRIAERLTEYGLPANRRHIDKWRLFHEMTGDESKINACCLYCGQPFGITQALKGEEVDIEHILPKSRIFDDSMQNRILVHRQCNANKGNQTAFDFMKSKSEKEFKDYVERVNALYKDKLIKTKAKRDKLLMTASAIPQDFIDRQLRQTQYISRKAHEILSGICYHVHATSGSVTARLRNLWGWDNVLHDLNFNKYKEAGLTEVKTIRDDDGNAKEVERIAGWEKRNDHRHHAIDALAIACTKQGFIQRINRINADDVRSEMVAALRNRRDLTAAGLADENGLASLDEKIDRLERIKGRRLSLLDLYLQDQKTFTTGEVSAMTSRILVSFKAGKKVASKGIRKIHKGKRTIVAQDKGILVPRGALSEESVYGRSMKLQKGVDVKKLFDHPESILKKRIRELIEKRLDTFGGDRKKAISSLKKDPIFLDAENKVKLDYASILSPEYVIKYAVKDIKKKHLPSIVDGRVQKILETRINTLGEKDAFKDLESHPVWYNEQKSIRIRTVRRYINLDDDSVAPVKFDENCQATGFVKPGNNHHIAIYKDADGNLHEHVCTLWHAVERKKYGLNPVIKKPNEAWNIILSSKTEIPESFSSQLPMDGWEYVMSLQQNEMFLLGMKEQEIRDSVENSDYASFSGNLYRVQKLGASYYVFRHHVETQIDDSNEAQQARRFKRIRSLNAFMKEKPYKLKLNVTGKIASLEECLADVLPK